MSFFRAFKRYVLRWTLGRFFKGLRYYDLSLAEFKKLKASDNIRVLDHLASYNSYRLHLLDLEEGKEAGWHMHMPLTFLEWYEDKVRWRGVYCYDHEWYDKLRYFFEDTWREVKRERG